MANADSFMSILKGEMKDVVCQNVDYAEDQIMIIKQVLLSVMKTSVMWQTGSCLEGK